MLVRQLHPGDEEKLEAFLVQYIDSSMFLRGNMRVAGLIDDGSRYGGAYVAAFEDDRIIGVAAHYQIGNVIVQLPVRNDEVLRRTVELSGREVTGFLGPYDQIVAACEALAFDRSTARYDSRQGLYALALNKLNVPDALAEHRVSARLFEPDDFDTLIEWYLQYVLELSGEAETPKVRQRWRDGVQRMHDEKRAWVLIDDDELVASTAFNSALPDIVQIGGVFTPTDKRSRGYAKCAVAASLIEARDNGVERAVLFTGEDNVPAIRAYEALGFEKVGDYGLIFTK